MFKEEIFEFSKVHEKGMDSYAVHRLAPKKETKSPNNRGKSPLLQLLKRTTSRANISPMIDGEFEDFGINHQSENGQVQMCSLSPKLSFDFKQGSKSGDHDPGGIVRYPSISTSLLWEQVISHIFMRVDEHSA